MLSVAFMVMLPATPVPVLSEEMAALLFICSLETETSILPPAPIDEVEVLMPPLSAIVKRGVLTEILPAFPEP